MSHVFKEILNYYQKDSKIEIMSGSSYPTWPDESPKIAFWDSGRSNYGMGIKLFGQKSAKGQEIFV